MPNVGISEKAGSASVDIEANLKPLQDGLAKAEEMVKGWAAKTAAAMVGLGAAAVGGLGLTIKFADDLAKSTKYASLVFGSASSIITESSEKMSTRFGVSRREMVQGMTEIGEVFRRIGTGPRLAAGVSSELAKVAVAVGKLRDVDAETALKAIEYGLEGSTRGLKILGVHLTEDQIEMEAFRQASIKYGDSFSETDLTIARASVIMKALGVSARAMANEQPSLSTKVSSAWAAIKHAFEDIGTAFLPIAHRIIDGVQWIADSISVWVSNHKADMDYFVSSVQWALDKVIAIAKDWRERFTSYLSEKGINTESFVKAFHGISAMIKSFFDDIEDYAAILVIRIKVAMINFQEIFDWSAKGVYSFAQNFKRDWEDNIISTIGRAIEGILDFYRAAQRGGAKVGDIIGAWMAGGKPLPWNQPALPERQPIPGPGKLALTELDKDLKEIVDRLKARQEARNRPFVGPLRPEEGGAAGKGAAGPKKKALEYPTPMRRAGTAEFIGLADFAKKIQTTALSQQINYSRQTAAYTRRSAVALEQLTGRKAGNEGANAVLPE